MKKIAVVGTGTIGHMIGGFLTHGGYDVTVVSQFRRTAAEVFKEKGITVRFNDQTFHVPVKASFWEDLDENELFDIIMITGSADFTADAIEKMRPHASENAFWSSFQNGIPEDIIIPAVGKENVIPVVCFAGGRTPELGTVVTHDGFFIIGELSGEITPRLQELKEILSCAKRVEITTDIMSARWEKLCMAVATPARTVSGLESYEDENLRICVARCAVEYGNLANACGAHPAKANNVPFSVWPEFVNGAKTPEREKYLIDACTSQFMPSKEELGDMQWKIPAMELAGSLVPDGRLPMEGHHTMGYVVRKAHEMGVPVPMYDFLYPYVCKVMWQQILPDPKILRDAVAATDSVYRS